MGNVPENEDDFSYDESEMMDDMSRLTMDSGDESEFNDTHTFLSKQTGFKSTRFRSRNSIISRSSKKKSMRSSTGSLLSVSEPKRFNIRGLTSIGLPYIVDVWGNSEPRNACSLQIWWLSGDPKPTVRVSTDQDEVVIDILLPGSATDPMVAFASYLKTDENKDFIDHLIKYHPKSIARTRTVAKLCNRDNKNPQIWLSQRIRSPFALDYHYSSKSADILFYGTRWVDYEHDGTRWLHIELVEKQKDNYKGLETMNEDYFQGVAKSVGEMKDGSADDGDDNASGNLMSCAATYKAKDLSGAKRASVADEEEEEDAQPKKKKNAIGRDCMSLVENVSSPNVRRTRSMYKNDDVTL